MNNQIVEIEVMKICSDCGILKKKTHFYFRNINRKFKKECAQCTKFKQRVYYSDNKEKIIEYKE